MSPSQRQDPEPTGVSTVDLLLLTAGFACGWVMDDAAFAVVEWNFRLPLWYGGFASVLGHPWLRWLWAFVVGLAFLVVGRRFRYDCRKRPAEWLAVALAIVLFESVYPAFRTGLALSTCETVWVEPSLELKWAYAAYLRKWGYPKPDRPFALDLWWPVFSESWQELAWIALPLTVLAVTTAILAWRLRAKLSPGWIAVMLVVVAVLIAFGPIRLAEATSSEVIQATPNPDYQPKAGEKPWSWTCVAAYYDMHAWAGYLPRALVLMTLALVTARSLWSRWKKWLWTEWAAAACATVLAACWIHDEFVERPALDWTVRIVLLGSSLFVTAAAAEILILGWSKLAGRIWAGEVPLGQTGMSTTMADPVTRSWRMYLRVSVRGMVVVVLLVGGLGGSSAALTSSVMRWRRLSTPWAARLMIGSIATGMIFGEGSPGRHGGSWTSLESTFSVTSPLFRSTGRCPMKRSYTPDVSPNSSHWISLDRLLPTPGWRICRGSSTYRYSTSRARRSPTRGWRI